MIWQLCTYQSESLCDYYQNIFSDFYKSIFGLWSFSQMPSVHRIPPFCLLPLLWLLFISIDTYLSSLWGGGMPASERDIELMQRDWWKSDLGEVVRRTDLSKLSSPERLLKVKHGLHSQTGRGLNLGSALSSSVALNKQLSEFRTVKLLQEYSHSAEE